MSPVPTPKSSPLPQTRRGEGRPGTDRLEGRRLCRTLPRPSSAPVLSQWPGLRLEGQLLHLLVSECPVPSTLPGDPHPVAHTSGGLGSPQANWCPVRLWDPRQRPSGSSGSRLPGRGPAHTLGRGLLGDRNGLGWRGSGRTQPQGSDFNSLKPGSNMAPWSG